MGKFQNITKKEWYIQGFNSSFNYIFHGPVSAMIDCYNELGFGYTEMLFIFKKDYLDYHYLIDDFINVGNEFLRRYKKDPDYINQLIKRDKILFADAEKVMNVTDKTDFNKLDKKGLVDLYHQMWNAYHKMAGVNHIIEGISYVVEPILRERLEKITGFERHDKRFREVFGILMQPERPSFVNLEIMDLFEIIKLIKKDKNNIELFKLSEAEILQKVDKDLLRKISEHKKRFYYNQLNYFDGDGLRENDYIREIKTLISEDIESKIKEEKERYLNNINQREEAINQYKLDKETVDLIKLSITALHWQDDRKKNMLSCVYYINLLLKEISKKFNISFDVLKKYAPIEITNERLDNFNMEDAKERMKHFVVYMKKAGDKIDVEIYTKKDYDKFMKAYLKKLSARPEIHGSTASPGKISGYVRICNTKEDIMNFKKGEILVASMTRPDSVPAMKKAIGIITDEGGITCHAAIVSRELGIPCVIGTKIATKVLKDGDFVEINANHGVVKIIRK